MNALVTAYPRLSHFLNAYMHQDWRLYGDTVEDVVKAYARDSSSACIATLRLEIREFLNHHEDRRYYELFPNSVLPSGIGMSVKDWLGLIDIAAEQEILTDRG